MYHISNFYFKLILRIAIIVFCVFSISSCFAIERASFYNVFSQGTMPEIDVKLTEYINSDTSSQINAYRGALLLKKSGLIKIPTKKIQTARLGIALLEREIQLHPQNIEFRFLRLVIQEQTPDILKYKANLVQDNEIILKYFNSLDEELKLIIKDYAIKSKVLNSAKLN